MASPKRQNIDVKILVAEVERWLDDEKSSEEDQEKDKCFMAHIDVFALIKEVTVQAFLKLI